MLRIKYLRYIFLFVIFLSICIISFFVINALSIDTSECVDAGDHPVSQMCGIEVAFLLASAFIVFLYLVPYALMLIALTVRKKIFSLLSLAMFILVNCGLVAAILIDKSNENYTAADLLILLPCTLFFICIYLVCNREVMYALGIIRPPESNTAQLPKPPLSSKT